MINVNIHPNTADATAKATSGASGVNWLEIECGGSSVVFFCDAHQLEAFRMIADIFNDAFARKAEPCTPAR